MTPGPTSVPPEVLAALAEPVAHHRTPGFRAIFAEVEASLRWVFQTQQPVCVLTASGTAGLEAALTTILSPGARVLSVNSGRFARRWGMIARQFGMEVVDVAMEPGAHITPDGLAPRLAAPNFDAVLITHSETSTGTACDLAALSRVVHERSPKTLVMVDAITSIGALPFYMDDWGVDVAVAACQKALMVPPGLSYVSLSERAWAVADRNSQPQAFYFDLRKYRNAARNDDTAFTPAISLIKGQAQALRMLRQEGLEKIWQRTRMHAEVVRRGMRAMGLSLLSRMPADSVTAVRYPEGVEDTFRRLLASEHNIHVAGGQDEMAGKIFRVNHMGYTDLDDAMAVVSATEDVLRKLGRNVEPGVGLAAARSATQPGSLQ